MGNSEETSCSCLLASLPSTPSSSYFVKKRKRKKTIIVIATFHLLLLLLFNALLQTATFSGCTVCTFNLQWALVVVVIIIIIIRWYHYCCGKLINWSMMGICPLSLDLWPFFYAIIHLMKGKQDSDTHDQVILGVGHFPRIFTRYMIMSNQAVGICLCQMLTI